MAVKKTVLSLAALATIEGDLLDARLRAARSSISHAGEKGRALEHEARSLLRSFLPAEYGLSTGFVAFHGADGIEVSKQLDIIIFDAIRGGPLVSLQSCEIFPLESVFGYVEVKAQLSPRVRGNSSLAQILRDNAVIRQMTKRYFRVASGNSPAEFETREVNFIPVRAYVMAFETAAGLKPAHRLGQQLANTARRVRNAHIHGIYAGQSGFAAMRAVNPKKDPPKEWHHAFATDKDPVLAFKAGMLRGLSSFPRVGLNMTLAYEAYMDAVPSLKKYAPESAIDDEVLNSLASIIG